MSSTTNAQTLKGAHKALERINERYLYSILELCAKNLLKVAVDNASGWLGFTGNLPRSYAAGIYDSKKRLSRIIWAGEVYAPWDKPAVAKKIEYGRTKLLENPYEGRRRLNVWSDAEERVIRNPTPVVYDDGRAFSSWFLSQYTPTYPFSIVVCTGAEYSEWLERDRGKGGVLTKASKKAGIKLSMTNAIRGKELEFETIAQGELPFEQFNGDVPF